MQKIFELLRSWYQEGEKKEIEKKSEGQKGKSKTETQNAMIDCSSNS